MRALKGQSAWRSFAVAFGLTSLFSVASFAAPPAREFSSMRVRQTSPLETASYIRNFRLVAPGLYAGANPIDLKGGVNGFDLLAANGIKVDVDLQGTDITEAPNAVIRRFNSVHEPGEHAEMIAREARLSAENGIEFINLPINSNHAVNADEVRHINAILNLMEAASPTRPVFLHCEHGADRTGLVIALYRVLKQGRSIDEANAEWTRNGHGYAERVFTHALDDYFCARVRGISSSQTCG